MTKLEKLQVWCQIHGYQANLRTGKQWQVLFVSGIGENPDAALVDVINGEGLAAALEQYVPTMPANYKRALRVTEAPVKMPYVDITV